MKADDLQYLRDLVESAQAFWRTLDAGGFFDKLDADEKAMAVQAFPDGPLSAHAWHVWFNAIEDEGFAPAWRFRPWSYVNGLGAEVLR